MGIPLPELGRLYDNSKVNAYMKSQKKLIADKISRRKFLGGSAVFATVSLLPSKLEALGETRNLTGIHPSSAMDLLSPRTSEITEGVFPNCECETSPDNFSIAADFPDEDARYEIILEENRMVPLRDGVKLATDIYFPGTNGVIARAGFGHSDPYLEEESAHGRDHNGYVPYGYIMVKQDTRERKFRGTWHWMTDDNKDGYDTIEWIANNPVRRENRYDGCSYHGATQHLPLWKTLRI